MWSSQLLSAVVVSADRPTVFMPRVDVLYPGQAGSATIRREVRAGYQYQKPTHTRTHARCHAHRVCVCVCECECWACVSVSVCVLCECVCVRACCVCVCVYWCAVFGVCS